MIRTGLDRLLESPDALAGRRFGLLSHSAARSANLEPIHLALLGRGAPPPTRLFGPEHGFYGVEQDMIPSADEVDPWIGIPIVSLYGDSDATLHPDPESLRDLDLLVIDLQDVGSRYYTYAATGIWAAGLALEVGIEVWILDRPNPLGGVEVEGNLVAADFHSFVGAFRLPTRHGLTFGEMVRLQAQRERWPGDFRVWEVEGWQREMLWSDLQRPWFAPSPNLPSFETALLFPGLCLIEGTELSEGRGTTRPFQLVGAPRLPAVELAAELESRRIPGVRFLPTLFRPQFHKHQGEICSGIEARVTDGRKIRPVRCGIEILAAIKKLAPESLRWRLEPYEFISNHPAIDLLSGDDRLRSMLDDGVSPVAWMESWSRDEREFHRERAEILLYPEA